MEESEKTAEVQPVQTQTPAPKSKKTHATTWFLAVILMIAAGAGAYWWRDSQAKNQHKTDQASIAQLQAQLAEAKTKAATEMATTPTSAKTETAAVPTSAVKDNVIASIKSGNTAALEGYMAASVHVVIAASSGVFDHTPAQAVTDLNYINSAVAPWDFALSTSVLAGYGTGDYKDYFKSNSVVGKSADGKVVAFNFNTAGKINGVFMSSSADLL